MTEKTEKDVLLENIDNTATVLLLLIFDNKDKINRSISEQKSTYKNPIDILISYSVHYAGLQKEIVHLQRNRLFLSLQPLTRVSLESYSFFKMLSEAMLNNAHNEYNIDECVEIIAFSSINQEFMEYQTLSSTEKAGTEGQSYLQGLSAEIIDVFSSSIITYKTTDTIDIDKTVNNIKKTHSHVNIRVQKRVKRALQANALVKRNYTDEQISYVYPNLCKASHSNLAAILENTTIECGGTKIKTTTHENENDLFYLELGYYCLCDIYRELETLLTK